MDQLARLCCHKVGRDLMDKITRIEAFDSRVDEIRRTRFRQNDPDLHAQNYKLIRDIQERQWEITLELFKEAKEVGHVDENIATVEEFAKSLLER